MATLARRETMGQPGQRTLLPFFGKDLAGSSVNALGANEGPTTASTADNNEDGGSSSPRTSMDAVVNDVAEQNVTKASNQQRSSPERDGSPKTQSETPEMDSNHDTYEIQESSRAKRRKTGPRKQTRLNPEDGSLQSDADATTSTPDPASLQPNTATNGAEPCSDPPSNAIPNDTPKSQPGLSPPERKMLQLNPNGKLLSSPPRVALGSEGKGSSDQKRKLRGRKRDASGTNPLSLVTCIHYGEDEKSRQYIGNQIDEIMLGNKRNEIPKKHKQKPNPPPEAPKAIHPFFLSKPTHPKPATGGQLQGQPEVSEKDDGSTPPISTDKVVPSSTPVHSKIGDGGLNNSFKSTRKSNSTRSGETREPIWPPRDFVHIRGSSPGVLEGAVGYDFPSYHEKKAKGSTLNISDSESVLSIPQLPLANHSSDIDAPKKLLRLPKQIKCQGREIRDLTVGKLSDPHAYQPNEVCESSADSGPKKFENRYPALTSLASSLSTARSSFERGQCDDILWIQKYAPKTAEEVIQQGPEAVLLRYWLQNHEISAVNTGHTSLEAKSTKRTKAESGARRKRQKRPKDLDSFIVSSDDEESHMDELDGPPDEDDELVGGATVPPKKSIMRATGFQGDSKRGDNDRRTANAVLLSGPSGCGKTAAVYAAARELGFEVFEVNPGSRRSARDVVERVGDMTQNHLVHLLNQIDSPSTANTPFESSSAASPPEGQNTMTSFFKKKPEPTNSEQHKPVVPDSRGGDADKLPRSQKQSLILLEEVDILFEQDKQFWNGVMALMSQSKRPIIMTCNEEQLVPTDDLSLHAIFRFRPPPRDIAVDYLLLMAANEGHIVNRQPVSELYTVLGCDLRSAIMHLDFWCQMAVGSRKAGIDWLVNCPYRGALASNPESSRAVSRGTYNYGMGWYSHDIAADEYDSVGKWSRLMMDCLDQWNIGIADWHEAKQGQSYPDVFKRVDALTHEDEIADVKSALDCMCPGEGCGLSYKDNLDVAAPDITDKERANYVEGYNLIQADRKPDFSRLSTEIAATLSVLLEECMETDSKLRDEHSIIDHVLDSLVSRQQPSMRPVDLQRSFDDFINVCDSAASSLGQRPISFMHGADVTARDLAPYVRAIVGFDLRLERTRLELSGPVPPDGGENKRVRTTRASRAALEGGDKATTRRERWFPGRLNTANILATGGRDWQDILLRWEEELLTPQDGDTGSSGGDGGM